jgi:hypothetical protein
LFAASPCPTLTLRPRAEGRVLGAAHCKSLAIRWQSAGSWLAAAHAQRGWGALFETLRDARGGGTLKPRNNTDMSFFLGCNHCHLRMQVLKHNNSAAGLEFVLQSEEALEGRPATFTLHSDPDIVRKLFAASISVIDDNKLSKSKKAVIYLLYTFGAGKSWPIFATSRFHGTEQQVQKYCHPRCRSY